jgi:hypothetical protein
VTDGERSDDDFLAAFEECTLPNAEFHHRDHVRLTWLLLARWGDSDGMRRTLEGIERFATANGAASRFDAALTRTWVRLVAAARRDAPVGETFSAFLARCPQLLDRSAAKSPDSSTVAE